MNIQRATRRLLTTAFAVSLLVALAACGGTVSSDGGDGASGDKGEVIVYDGGGTWGAAQDAAYFTPFEQETGIKVVRAPAPTPGQLQTALDAGNPGIDVYDLPGTDVGAWRAAGDLIQPIDFSSWPQGQRDAFAPYPTMKDAVPALIFAAQLAWDERATKGPLPTWADFFNTQKFPGKRTMGDVTAAITCGTFEAALLADGVPADELYPLDIDRAFRKLDQIKPQILKFWTTGAEPIQLLIDKQVSAAASWNGRVSTAQAAGAPLQSTWNQAILEVDYWVIPKGAKNAANASKFIEFASRPEQQAQFSRLISYSPTNSLAYKSIPADQQANLPTAPDHVEQTIPSDNDFWGSQAPSGVPWSQEVVTRWQKWLSN